MNPRRCDEYDYINFWVAAQKSYSCLEAGRVQPPKLGAPAHDSLTRLLRRKEPNTEDLWQEAQPQVNRTKGLLLLDDSTLDKPYAKQIDLVWPHWSGKPHQTVRGINWLTLLWTEGDKHILSDYRLYEKPNDNLSKNDHFADLLQVAHQRGFKPAYVCFDSWYSGLSNLKRIRQWGWHWFTRLKSNCLVNPDHSGNVPIARIDIGPPGRVVHLKAYGLIKVFRTVSPAAQRNHIGFSIRAFLRLEVFSYLTGYSWFEAKRQIIREAIRAYLQNPKYILSTTA